LALAASVPDKCGTLLRHELVFGIQVH